MDRSRGSQGEVPGCSEDGGVSIAETRGLDKRPDWATVCDWVDGMRDAGLWPLAWACPECGRTLRGATRAVGAEDLAAHLLEEHGVQLVRCGDAPLDQALPCALPHTHEGRHASSAGDWI